MDLELRGKGDLPKLDPSVTFEYQTESKQMEGRGMCGHQHWGQNYKTLDNDKKVERWKLRGYKRRCNLSVLRCIGNFGQVRTKQVCLQIQKRTIALKENRLTQRMKASRKAMKGSTKPHWSSQRKKLKTATKALVKYLLLVITPRVRKW